MLQTLTTKRATMINFTSIIQSRQLNKLVQFHSNTTLDDPKQPILKKLGTKMGLEISWLKYLVEHKTASL